MMESVQWSTCNAMERMFVENCRIPIGEMTTKGILVLSGKGPQPIPWIAGGEAGLGAFQ